ncbi:PadR family transcriptional regulator [Paenibacillus sp.]|uniref:PadR family transcriptional regulator n=1 Tax=Paenibacillus sp. TaxID=58172 RepID=UPI002D5FEB01|nr:PadR family transcriptional regulator [Paenibacillus sp.]HZG55844.1 PadR family transcriptional regulator [Paenibacillus sp.]
MEYVILGLLMYKPQTLYELNKAFRQGIALFYSASYGSLQAALKKLTTQGAVSCEAVVEHGRNKKVYAITPVGREAFAAWMEADIPEQRLETTALSKLYFLGLVEEREKQREIVRAIIGKIESVESELRALERSLRLAGREGEGGDIDFRRKTLDYGIHAHAFAKGWFAALLKELSAAPSEET